MDCRDPSGNSRQRTGGGGEPLAGDCPQKGIHSAGATIVEWTVVDSTRRQERQSEQNGNFNPQSALRLLQSDGLMTILNGAATS